MLRTNCSKFTSKVSLLVGKIFIERKSLSVKVSIVPGDKVKHVMDPKRNRKIDEFNCGEIINSKKAMTYDRSKDEASAEFQNLMLKKITRDKGNKKSSDLVTEEKFSIIFWTDLVWENYEIQLGVASMPVVVVSHDSQKVQAMATIVWDNAGEESFVERENLSWNQVNRLFSIHLVFCQISSYLLTWLFNLS